MQTLHRFPDLKPIPNGRGGFSYPKPMWSVSSRCQERIDTLPTLLKVPTEWPALRRTFAHVGFMKTTEAMQYAGPVGCYILRLTDMEASYKLKFTEFFSVMELLMRKASSPAQRRDARARLRDVMFELEMGLPHRWSTMVRHVMSDHAVDTIEKCGPFPVHNMLCRETFQGAIKGLCRGRQAMASILVHAKLWEASMQARMALSDTEWVVAANGSTVDGRSNTPSSADRFGLVASPSGAGTAGQLDRDSFKQVRLSQFTILLS